MSLSILADLSLFANNLNNRKEMSCVHLYIIVITNCRVLVCIWSEFGIPEKKINVNNLPLKEVWAAEMAKKIHIVDLVRAKAYNGGK